MRHERVVRLALCVVRRIRAGWLAVVVASTLPAPNLGAQISPGPLANAHASLDGPLSCTKCHGGGKASMTSRCLACHREIASLIEQNRGYHARIPRSECASCHPDHAGRAFDLVKWPDGGARQFDHGRTGYALEAKHADVACEKCHTSSLRVSPVAQLGPPRTKTSWVGLDENCASCHRDVHKGTLARTCERCHTTDGWSPAANFDHARTRYPLTGKHVSVSCVRCHAAVAEGAGATKLALASFRPLAHTDCASCHHDPHGGRLRGACSSCHNTASFTSVGGRNFSHDRTRFPLLGKHVSVACVNCHADYPRKIDRPAFATCTACHIDYHRGQATIAGVAADCSACHTVAGFTPGTFSVAQHARTRYPLVGRHTSVSCTSCHVRRVIDRARNITDVVMRPAAYRCESCHATSAHGSELASRGSGAACVTCHTPAGWKPSAFGVREHAALKFVLTGQHAIADCGSCHSALRRGLPAFPVTRSLGTAKIAFHLDESTCDACHRDPHGGRSVAASGSPAGTCAACHDTRAFHPSTVDVAAHARFAFPLEGAHRAAPCVACHLSMTLATTLGASLKLSPAPARPLTYSVPGRGRTCAVCHQSPHGNQFASRADGGACQSCHDVRGWSPASRFVHDANGGFTLGAAHEKLACDRCHVVGAGKRADLRLWRGVPRACETCHTNGARKS